MSNPAGWRAPVVTAPPEPGDFCCVPVSGAVGLGITIGQWLDGDRFQFYDHAEVYIGLPDEAGPHGYTVSAYPDKQGRKPLPCPPAELPGSLWSSGLIPLTPVQRQGIVTWATAHQHTGYSVLDYAALILHRLGVSDPGLRRFIGSQHRLICSQFVDTAFSENGVHLYADGRWSGFVTPGDLARLLLALVVSGTEPETG